MKHLNTFSEGNTLPFYSYNAMWLRVALLALGVICYTTNAQAQTCTYSEEDVTDVKSYVNGDLSSTDVEDLLNGVRSGTRVKVCFTPPAGTSTYTLVSYEAVDSDFNEETADQQVVYDYQTITTNGERVCLEIEVPNCYYQIDFVKGCKIDNLGPAGTDNFYGRQGRLIADRTGGKTECVAMEGCTLGYWKNHTDRWCSTYTTTTTFGSVFSEAPANLANITLLAALKLGGGGENNLARQGVAALLNACSDEVASPYSVGTVIYLVDRAFRDGTEGTVASELDELNNAGCPLGGTRATTATRAGLQAADIQDGMELRAYPIPFADKATIEFRLAENENYVVNLYDMKGALVKELKAGTSRANELQRVEITGNGLTEGLYFAKMTSNSGTKTIKLLFKRE